MYNLQRINPLTHQHSTPLAWFVDDLPKKPYCSQTKAFQHIRNKDHAINHAYIQPNDPNRTQWLVFDIDQDHAVTTYHDLGLPVPQIIAENPANGHCHYYYRLQTPVYRQGKSSHRAIKYLIAVYTALALALGADMAFTGNLAKNPLSDAHNVIISHAKPYNLADLHNFLDLEYTSTGDIKDTAEVTAFGRNVTLFDTVRHKTYPIADQYDYEDLLKVVEGLASQVNQGFDTPLPHGEIMHTVRSICRFCKGAEWGEYSQRADRAFSELQKHRIKQRWGDNTEKKKQAKIWLNEGMKIPQIAEKLDVNRSTLTRWGLRAKKK